MKHSLIDFYKSSLKAAANFLLNRASAECDKLSRTPQGEFNRHQRNFCLKLSNTASH
jgi:hypothetical protein